MGDPVLIERDGPVIWLTLNDPPYNPIGLAMVDRLEALLPELAEDDSVRVLVFRGAGDRSFSVGANIKEFGEAISRLTLKGFIEQRLRVLSRIEMLGKPVICAIRGICIGGGLELALSSHFRVVEQGARLGLPEIDLGIVPAWGGTQRLTRIVGRAHALDMMLRARKLDAEEALRIGLVHRVCSEGELEQGVRELAADLAGRAPLAVAGILDAVIRGEPLTLDAGLALEFEAVERTGRSRDAQEGIRAFLQKREPTFTGS